MPDLNSVTPYRWLMTGKSAVHWSIQALNAITNRITEINPIDNTEELAYCQKCRDALQKALKEIQFIENIKP